MYRRSEPNRAASVAGLFAMRVALLAGGFAAQTLRMAYFVVNGAFGALIWNVGTAMRVASLALGGGTLDVVSGKLTAAALTGSGAIKVRECGQFFGPGIAAAPSTVTGGRRVFTGAATGTLTVSGDAECMFGADYTLAAGQTMTLTGGACWVGWDGTGTADLKLQGALVMRAEGGKLPTIARFRSGRFGTVEPTVTPAITLSGPLVLDLTGMAVGTYTLISGTITGALSSHAQIGLSAGLSYAVTTTANAVTVTIS